jgi:hypothetical protein
MSLCLLAVLTERDNRCQVTAMHDQLRIYTIKPGELEDWIDEWRRLIAPLRRRYGFEIMGAWSEKQENRFIWLLRYVGSETWEKADAAYYASPERKVMQPDPARHIAKAEHWKIFAVVG